MISDAQWLMDRYDKAVFVELSVSRGLPAPTGFSNGKPQYDGEVDWALVEQCRRDVIYGIRDMGPRLYGERAEPTHRRKRRKT